MNKPGDPLAEAPQDDMSGLGTEQAAFLDKVKAQLGATGNVVLVVDDELTVRKVVARSIKKASPDVTIVEALNGDDALQKLRGLREKTHREPLFIVTDLQMPVMDGWTFIAHLQKEYEARGQHQGIPVIVLSVTSGEKGLPFMKVSVHGKKCTYSPLITVAKESCIDASKYDAKGEHGLLSWVQYFLQYA